MIGKTLGHYRIVEKIDEGGEAEVYRARDERLDRDVALKLLPAGTLAEEAARHRFRKEALALSKLNHPNIETVYDFDTQEGVDFLVVEHIAGVTLSDKLAGGPLPEKEITRLGVQLAEGLAAAHAEGVVHRDLKPGNLRVTLDGRLKVLDFGLAKVLQPVSETATTESLTETQAVTGTLPYMAPEQLCGEPADARTDIWAAGVVLYELATGQRPFREALVPRLTDAILHQAPLTPRAVNARVSPELERIILKCMEKDPDDRYQSAKEVGVDLRSLQRVLTDSRVRPAPAAPRKGKYVRVRQGFMLAVVLFLVLVTLYFFPRPTPRIRVAVLPFANRTGDVQLERFRLTLTYMLMLDLAGSPNIRLLPYERLLEIIHGVEAQGHGISTPEAKRALADYSNAQFVVVPAMFGIGSTFGLSAEFQDAQKGESVGATHVLGELSKSGEDTLYNALDDLVEEIQKHFKRAGPAKDYQPPPKGSRPKTVAAAFYFTEGSNAFAEGNYAQALNSFQRVVKEDPGFALAHFWMSRIYGLLGYDDKARPLSEKAAQLISAQTPIIDAHFIEANLAERKYDYSTARDKYLELVRLYPDEPLFHTALGAVYAKQEQYQEAIASYHEALRKDSNYGLASQQLASLYSAAGDVSTAVSQGQKALSLYQALRNRAGEASALVTLGQLFQGQGKYQQAREHAASALEMFERLGNKLGVMQAAHLLGNILYREGDFSGARRSYTRVLATRGEIYDNRLIVTTLMNMGVTYLAEGEFSKAFAYVERSIAQEQLYGAYQDRPTLRDRALALGNLANILIEYGPEPERGFRYLQQVLSLYEVLGDKSREAWARMLIGLYHMNAGRDRQAVDHLQASLALYRAIDHARGIVQSTYNIGRCNFFQNRYGQALDSLESALSKARDLPDPFRIALSQILLGWTYHRLGDLAKARALLEEGLRAAEGNKYGELLPDAYLALGELYRDRGENNLAGQYFQQAVSSSWTELSVSESSVEARSNLGLLEAARGELARGLSHCQASVARARKLQHVHTLARTLINLASVFLLQKDYANAIQALDELSSLGERDLGLELRAQVYSIRGKALAGLGRLEEAKTSYRQAEEAIRELQQSLAPGHRESFAARTDIQALLH